MFGTNVIAIPNSHPHTTCIGVCASRYSRAYINTSANPSNTPTSHIGGIIPPAK